jgi:hypothetical protein
MLLKNVQATLATQQDIMDDMFVSDDHQDLVLETEQHGNTITKATEAMGGGDISSRTITS